jgi:hypothetical protein
MQQQAGRNGRKRNGAELNQWRGDAGPWKSRAKLGVLAPTRKLRKQGRQQQGGKQPGCDNVEGKDV